MPMTNAAGHLGLTDTPTGTLADLCRAHYRAAERIHVASAWSHQVRSAAAVVNADGLPFVILVERAREIVFRGAFYTTLNNGRYVIFGASLLDAGGFIPIRSWTDVEAPA